MKPVCKRGHKQVAKSLTREGKCRICRNERQQRRRKLDPERFRELHRRGRVRNKEKLLEKSRQRRKDNKEEILRKQREKRKANPERTRNQKARSYYGNYERVLERTREKRLGPGSSRYYKERLRIQQGLCDICSQEMSRPQQDHDHACCSRIPYGNQGKLRTRACGRCLRSLLCYKCNIRLGYVESLLIAISLLAIPKKCIWFRKAHYYLTKWRREHDNSRSKN